MKKTMITLSICLIVLVIAITTFFVFFPKKYEALISKYAVEYNIPKYLVASVVNIESGYNKMCVSPVGAVGLMQVLPSTAYDMANRLDMKIDYDDLFNEEINIKIGTFYLAYLIEMFNGNYQNALSAYNWGFSNVKNWISQGNVDEFGTITNIPIKETQEYIKKFSLNKFVYKNLYKF